MLTDRVFQATPTTWATRLMRTIFSSTQFGGPAAGVEALGSAGSVMGLGLRV